MAYGKSSGLGVKRTESPSTQYGAISELACPRPPCNHAKLEGIFAPWYLLRIMVAMIWKRLTDDFQRAFCNKL